MSDMMLCNRLNRLKDDVVRFKNAICAYETTDASRYPENFESLGMDMVLKAEAIACSTRNIVSIYPAHSRKHMLSTATDAQGIEVKNTKTGYEIVIPGLMPKRNSRHNVQFILEPLSYALEQFCNRSYVERMDKALIWYVYEYSEDTPARHIRDYDNLEAKEVLDMINAYFLVDDSGEHCELHYSTRRGNRDCTRIIISSDIDLISYPKIEVI